MTVSIAVATAGSAASVIEPSRRSIVRVAPTSAIHWVGTMTDDIALEYAPARFYGVLVGAFSLSAPLDPVSLAGATTAMVLACLVASLLPAHRAATVDPLVALKSE